MDLLAVALAWAVIVIVSMGVVGFLAPRWGRDPFGWLVFAAVMGPIAILALVGTRQSDRERPEPFDVREIIEARVGREPGERIVMGTDGSAASVAVAKYVADTHEDSGDVVLLAVLPHESRPRPDEGPDPEHERRVEEMTSPPAEVLRNAGLPARVIVGYGRPGEEILRLADEEDADLIAVGRRGGGVTRALLGSVSEHVVRNAKRPVVVVG